MINYAKLLLVTIGSYTISITNPFFMTLGIKEPYSLIVAALIAGLIYLILDYLILEFSLNIKWLRSFIYPNSLFEGEWVQRYEKNGILFYCYLTIMYSKHIKDFIIKGEAFDSTGVIHSNWKSTSLKMDIKNSEIIFVYQSAMLDESCATITGYSLMSFMKNNNGKYNKGHGYWVDSGANMVQCNYTLDRITKDLLKKTINKKSINANFETKQFVRKFHSLVTG